MAAYQTTWMLNVMASSRASSLPQGFVLDLKSCTQSTGSVLSLTTLLGPLAFTLAMPFSMAASEE